MDLNEILSYVKQLEKIYSTFTAFTKDNPVVGGMIGVWLLGVITYVLRSIPNKIITFLKRYFTVTMTLNNRHRSFHHFIRWYEKNKDISTNRTLRVSNGIHGYDDTQISLGFGNHYFMEGIRPFKMRREILSADGNEVKEEITLTTVGFSQKVLIDLIKKTIPTRKPNRHIYTLGSDGWKKSQKIPARTWESVILQQGQKERVLNFIKEFEQSKDWYYQMGISYKTGIIFEGPPGTGKSSLIKALANHLDKNLCVISCTFLTESGLIEAFNSTPKDSLILMEDFDSIKAGRSRTIENPDDKGDALGITLSGLLNAIDGVFSSDGRILIATTNHIEKLDDALLRPGRFDLTEKIDYADEDMVLRMFNKFYPEFEINSIKLQDKISLAQVENCFLMNKNNPELAKKEVESFVKVEYKPFKAYYPNGESEVAEVEVSLS